MSLQYAVSRRSVGSHCTPGGVTVPPGESLHPYIGINDGGVIQPGESLIPLTAQSVLKIGFALAKKVG